MSLSRPRPIILVAGIALTLLTLLLVFFDFFNGYLARAGAGAAPGNAWLFAALITVGYVRYTLRVMPGVRARALDWAPVKLWAVPLAVLTGIVVEVGLRAGLMDSLAQAGLGVGWQILGSALVFGLMHGLLALIVRDHAMILPAAISMSVLGGCLAVLYLSGGRNIWPCVVAQVLINLTIEPWRLLAAANGSWREAGAELPSAKIDNSSS